ncbi:unnamed protein product [Leptosia nina]|uniref:Uncharacterized protein n=1 Tax=Leptosia nina TaxID=320188 RepID=A0AAV1JX85_9NEOP
MAIELCGISLTADAIKTKFLDMEESGNGGDNRAFNSSDILLSSESAGKDVKMIKNNLSGDNSERQPGISEPMDINAIQNKFKKRFFYRCGDDSHAAE